MKDNEAKQITQEAEIIMRNLEKYPFMKKFFGNIIKQRLQIECYTHGMLTANLLSHKKLTELDLKRLECVLKLGESYCRDFKQIFQGKRLPKQSEIADGQIIDIIAEVKAFEFLYSQDFKDIANIKRAAGARTVDFTAQRNKENYAIEATRLGLAQSQEKQPAHTYEIDTISYAKCEDANGFRVTVITEGLNVCRLAREISDAIEGKYDQMKSFCQERNGLWKGILFISSGRDFFAMCKYENKEYEITPTKDFRAAIEKVWEEREGQANYIHHIVITRGKDLNRAIICPSF